MPAITIDARVDRIQLPDFMRFDELLARQVEQCAKTGCTEDIIRFGISESPFPFPESLQAALQSDLSGHYSDPAGLPALRDAVSGFYQKNYGMSVDPKQVIIGPGAKGLLFPLFTLLNGSVIVPSPGWLGYLPLLRILNRPYYRIYGHRMMNYKIRPAQLAALLKGLVKTQHLLLLNNPGNPTGCVYSAEELSKIAEVCKDYNTLVLADETYSLMTYEPGSFVSMGKIYPEGTFVLGGLSMDRAAGGFRIGTCIMPQGCDQKVVDALIKILATMYTSASTPMQQAAIPAYQYDSEIDSWMCETRSIFRIMTTRLAALFREIPDVSVTIPQAGFSFMVDLNKLSKELLTAGIQYSNDLAPALIRHPYHIAVMTGESMMAPYSDFFIRICCTDFDGFKALEEFISQPPINEGEEDAFFMRHGSRMIAGVDLFRSWVEEIRSGRFSYKTDSQL